ncbi:hypothetical protein QE152_g409 [Popillia japonica]|uniref:Uncharacterized protein n=1 Tax=Popillia japonica TaxID=7064 RepID=A0AAW1NKZ5_POPJA
MSPPFAPVSKLGNHIYPNRSCTRASRVLWCDCVFIIYSAHAELRRRKQFLFLLGVDKYKACELIGKFNQNREDGSTYKKTMECFCTKPRTIHCKIILLDEQELIHEIQIREILICYFRTTYPALLMISRDDNPLEFYF